MDQGSHPLDTREFVALWNVAREEHIVHRFAAALSRLERQGRLPAMSEAQIGLLAHAMHLASDPAAGPAAALQFLDTQGGA